MTTTIPILMYHRVAPGPAPRYRKYTVSPRRFAAQMNWLALRGYTALSLDALLVARHSRAVLPERSVVITFDDGTQDCADYAAPILLKHGFTATFYLVAGLVGESSRWLRSERYLDFPLFDWDTARRLESEGFHCGAHTMTHPRLATLAPDECHAELDDCRRVLEDQLGHQTRHLAYPYGSYNAQVRDSAASCGYLSACTVEQGISTPADDVLALRRVHVSGSDSLLDFISRLSSAKPLAEALRGRAGLLRARLKHREALV